jgi:hypothetical protein
MRRELVIAFRGRVTWLAAAIAALLTGHGFMLAVDVYSAASRSALASALQSREMDPLAGIVRPLLGGSQLGVALLGPVVAARVLAVEKERGSFGALCLADGSIETVVLEKALAAVAACSLLLAPALLAVTAFALAGGHLDFIETSVAFLGASMHVALVALVSVAAAAWTRTTAQAAALGIMLSFSAWAIDAAEGFAALAWMGGASAWSIDQKIVPLERGLVSLGSVLWLGTAAIGALGFGLVGARFDWSRARRALVGGAALVTLALLLRSESSIRRAYDWTEARRASLPPAAVEALRRIPVTIAIDVWLDRDDSRRRQLEGDVLAKLTLARSDVVIRMPLDERATLGLQRDADYGRIVVRVGDRARETRSTSRREIVTLIFDAIGEPLPDWSQAPYPGFPTNIEGPRRVWLAVAAYALVPLAFAAAGLLLTRRRTAR